MLSNREILEMVIYGYEQLKMVAEHRGISVDELIIEVKECLNGNGNGCEFVPVKIKEVKELIEIDFDDSESRFFPIQKERKRPNLGMIRIKVK